MKKLLSLLKYVMLGIGLLTLILVFVLSDNAGVDIMLRWAYVLLGIAIVAAVLFPLINLAQNPKGAMRTLLGVALLAIVLGIAYAMSSAEPVVTPVDVYDNPASLKLTDTGLYTAYVALFGAILVAVFGEIRNSFK